jgi:signal transduction histidine kinase
MTTDNETSNQLNSNLPNAEPRFISMRWRFMTPMFFVVLTVAMVGAFLVARNISGGLQVSQTNVLMESTRSVVDRAAQLYGEHVREAQRVAFTRGVADAVQAHRPEALEPILKSLAQINEMDSIIVADGMGNEVLGILRVASASSSQFALSADVADFSQQRIIRVVLDGEETGATALMTTAEGVLLYTAVPIYSDDIVIGVALIGQRLDSVLEDLKSSAVADLVIYGPEGQLLQTTFTSVENRQALILSQEVFNQAFWAENSIPQPEFFVDGVMYQGTVQPFRFGATTLGVVGTMMPDQIPFITETGRQLTALLASVLAGAVVVVAFGGMSYFAGRAEEITHVADDLTAGLSLSRTQMKPTDEIGAVGHALDQYANYVQLRHDGLRQELRRQRREVAHLTQVLETIPDGVVVQDGEGRVMLMNDLARKMLGEQQVFKHVALRRLDEAVGQELGPALAPGLYALGDPHRIHLDDRVLSAQAAAITSIVNSRLGTVIILRDITNQVLLERQRDIMLQQLTKTIQQPLANMGRLGLRVESNLVQTFAREITRQAVALQKMVLNMRELSWADMASVQHRQRPLSLETLIWAVLNQWRQVAQANGLTMHLMIERQGLFVLADEKRLRWALGNILDNAVKYTPSGGALTLEIKEESDGMANIRIRDNGVGIIREERPFVFTRFYRGTPTKAGGEVIRVPGMGQGLYITRQIIESHGGSVYIKTSPRIGTAVYLTLPLTSPVGLELPRFQSAFEGETVQITSGFDFDQRQEE